MQIIKMHLPRTYTARIKDEAQESISLMATESPKRKKLTIKADPELVALAKAYFATTRDGSISGFLERKFLGEFRTKAARIRKAGFKVPERVFDK